MTLPTARAVARFVQCVALELAPHGGQQVARRNAWAAMSEGAVRARARREAKLTLDRAVERAGRGPAAAVGH